MNIFSRLPVNTLFFKHWDLTDEEVGVVLAKALFRVHPDGWMRAEAAPEIAYEDVFAGDPAWSPLLSEQDIAPGKVGTDLTIRAVARAFEGRLLPDWRVTVAIPDRLNYQVQVRGPSAWRRTRAGGWRRTDPEPVREVAFDYALAYGGRAPGPDGSEVVHGENPAGIGFATAEMLDAADEIAVPQIGLLGEFMTSDPLARMGVQGLGPIAKGWLPRRGHAGTFDAAWQRDRHPRMPADYSYRFWNAAPGPLQLDPPLAGNEEIVVTGVSARSEAVHLRLPGVACALALSGPAPALHPMVLDTVSLDLRDEDPTAHTASLVWRCRIPSPHLYEAGEVVSEKLEG